jgi:ABC-type transport system involved in cytochrome bd biosynthesis fused ATPase/permease subunit
MNPLVFNQVLRMVFQHWKPFLVVVVPAVVLSSVVLPGWAAAAVFLIAFAIAVLFLVAAFVRNFRRGFTGG